MRSEQEHLNDAQTELSALKREEDKLFEFLAEPGVRSPVDRAIARIKRAEFQRDEANNRAALFEELARTHMQNHAGAEGDRDRLREAGQTLAAAITNAAGSMGWQIPISCERAIKAFDAEAATQEIC